MNFVSLQIWIEAEIAEYFFTINWGSGCGSVGRAVTTDSRCPWFKSSHRPKFILNVYYQLYWKDKNKEKRGRKWPIFENKLYNQQSRVGIKYWYHVGPG